MEIPVTVYECGDPAQPYMALAVRLTADRKLFVPMSGYGSSVEAALEDVRRKIAAAMDGGGLALPNVARTLRFALLPRAEPAGTGGAA